MMIKINAKESVEIVADVFVNVINESGSQYISWDELTAAQVECFSGLSKEVQAIYRKYEHGMTA
ncbi:MAG: hypothetical protein QM483_03835 [Desulfuromusa sp.]